MKRVIVAGSRSFTDYNLLRNNLKRIFGDVGYDGDRYMEDITILSGGAKGADLLGERFAELEDLDCELYPADWHAHGKAAGAIRNRQMAENADVLVAFWDGQSRGTRHMIQEALFYGLDVYVYRFTPEKKDGD